ncbi:MAG: V-type ATP synthase subunit A, partial [Caldilineaceae bacterium]|nr:V-type ATP synthase subunit A [Caldilineaceae bacterium]
MSGNIVRIAGPVVTVADLPAARMYDVVQVGHQRLVGEAIRLGSDTATVQVYEDTNGLRVGDPVTSLGHPLIAELGPGLLGGIFDGLQRPLPLIYEQQGAWLARGLSAPALSRAQRWSFHPRAQVGQEVHAGDLLGTVQETAAFEHRILVPPHVAGTVTAIEAGDFTVESPVAQIKDDHGTDHTVTLVQRWPVRQPRPYRAKLEPAIPLITGQRVIDAFFPIVRGGTAIIPGGFGTGKTVMEQSLAKWIDADIVIYIGCGER